jgi:hypothetical protein
VVGTSTKGDVAGGEYDGEPTSRKSHNAITSRVTGSAGRNVDSPPGLPAPGAMPVAASQVISL